MTQLHVTIVGAEALQANLRGGREVVAGGLIRALREIGRVFVPTLKAETPRRTGRLANSTRAQLVGPTIRPMLQLRQGAKTINGSFYGHYVRGGTRAHTIRPVRARALHFFIGDKEIFTASVQHPGTRPNPYHLRAWTRIRGPVDLILAAAGARISAILSDIRGGG